MKYTLILIVFNFALSAQSYIDEYGTVRYGEKPEINQNTEAVYLAELARLYDQKGSLMDAVKDTERKIRECKKNITQEQKYLDSLYASTVAGLEVMGVGKDTISFVEMKNSGTHFVVYRTEKIRKMKNDTTGKIDEIIDYKDHPQARIKPLSKTLLEYEGKIYYRSMNANGREIWRREEDDAIMFKK